MTYCREKLRPSLIVFTFLAVLIGGLTIDTAKPPTVAQTSCTSCPTIMRRMRLVRTADQGFMLGEHDYIDKRWMYEESLRMPFLVRYPKLIPAGTTSDAMINNVDFAPTILAMAGVEKPDYMQGRSFLPIARRPAGSRRLADGDVLSLLDAYGPSRQSGSLRNPDEGL